MKTLFELFYDSQTPDLFAVPTATLNTAHKEACATLKNFEGDATEKAVFVGRKNVLEAELTRRSIRRRLVENVPLPTPDQLRIIAEETGFDVYVDDDARRQLADFHRAYDEDMASINAHSPSAMNRVFLDQQAKVNELAHSGGDVAGFVHKSAETLYEESRIKINAFRSSASRHSSDARNLAAPYVAQFVANLSEVVSMRESNERDLNARYRLDFKPSPVLALLLRTLIAFEDGQLPFTSGNPRDWAAFMNIGRHTEGGE